MNKDTIKQLQAEYLTTDKALRTLAWELTELEGIEKELIETRKWWKKARQDERQARALLTKPLEEYRLHRSRHKLRRGAYLDPKAEAVRQLSLSRKGYVREYAALRAKRRDRPAALYALRQKQELLTVHRECLVSQLASVGLPVPQCNGFTRYRKHRRDRKSVV